MYVYVFPVNPCVLQKSHCLFNRVFSMCVCVLRLCVCLGVNMLRLLCLRLFFHLAENKSGEVNKTILCSLALLHVAALAPLLLRTFCSN